MPSLIYRACLRTGVPSNTRYCQYALAEKLSRDLGIPLENILDKLPPTRGPAGHLFDPAEQKMSRNRTILANIQGLDLPIGPAGSIEQVR